MDRGIPKHVRLPTLGAVNLAVSAGTSTRTRAPGAPLFSELVELVEAGDLRLSHRGEAVAVRSLSLTDFHTLRAVVTNVGLLAEEPVEITCRNCDAPMTVSPCALLPLGPFVDGELDDPELDSTLDLASPHAVPGVRLLSGAIADEVRFERRTVGEAAELHRALRRRRYPITKHVVRGMGISSLGDETDAARIARALARASEDAWGAVTRHFLDAHYPPRLFAVALCSACGARNDIDAPFEREFDASPPFFHDARDGDSFGGSNEEPFPSFEAFASRAEALRRDVIGREDAEISFVVEGGVAACDDGGEPLLGSYVPGSEGGATAPSRAPEITVYYRTFRSVWQEEGAYDWESELRETIEHELEHHVAGLEGYDVVDEEERDEIGREAARVLGKRAIARSAVASLGTDVALFVRRTWPVWLLVVVATVAATLAER